jgi:DNA-binding NtrC family response regulator
MLATVILRQNNHKLSFSQTCRDALFAYDWPGNVRELKNAITKAAVLSDGDVFAEQELLDQLQPRVNPGKNVILPDFVNPDNYTWKEALAALRREYFQRLITNYPNRGEAMVQAKISKARLYDVINELGLK